MEDGDDAKEPRTLMRDATVQIGRMQRYRMQRRARMSRRTGGEDWGFLRRLVSQKDYGKDGFGKYFEHNADEIGTYVGEKSLPRDIAARLAGLAAADEPFLIIRGAFSERRSLTNLAAALDEHPDNPFRRAVRERAARLIDEGQYDLIAAALISATATEMRPKRYGRLIYRDFITASGAEKTQFANGGDMHLRYRTATSELVPSHASVAAKLNDETAARIVLHACIENPIADPIYLIRAADVVKRLSDNAKHLLRAESFSFFDNWDPKTLLLKGDKKAKRILYEDNVPDEWLSFDPNRFDPSALKAQEKPRRAVGELMRCIQQTAAEAARRIVLRRGDALLVDNYRSLVGRQEHEGHIIGPFIGPPLRWLRVYYGFPRRHGPN